MRHTCRARPRDPVPGNIQAPDRLCSQRPSPYPGEDSDAKLKSNADFAAKQMAAAKQNVIDVADLNATMNNSIQSGLAGMIGNMAEAAVSGGNIGATMLGGFGSMLSQLGGMVLKLGLGILAAKMALKTLNPYVAIAAGIGLIAVGAMFSNGAKSLGGSSGSTGSSGGGSYGSGGSAGPEFDTRRAATGEAQTIRLKVDGRDLVAVTNANKLYYGRIG